MQYTFIYIYRLWGRRRGPKGKGNQKSATDCVFDETEIAKRRTREREQRQASLCSCANISVLSPVTSSFRRAEGVQPYLIGFTSTVLYTWITAGPVTPPTDSRICQLLYQSIKSVDLSPR